MPKEEQLVSVSALKPRTEENQRKKDHEKSLGFVIKEYAGWSRLYSYRESLL